MKLHDLAPFAERSTSGNELDVDQVLVMERQQLKVTRA